MRSADRSLSLRDGVIRFEEELNSVSTWVKGPVINSIPDPKQREALEAWEVRVARAAKQKRGKTPWSPRSHYAITLEFRFHPPTESNQRLDAGNFVKPVVDALAAGLFSREQISPDGVWNYDDSNFRTLLIHRGSDVPSQDQEGVHLDVSVRQPAGASRLRRRSE